MPEYQELKDEYALLWSAMKVRPEKLSAVSDVVETILLPNRRSRYEAVQAETGVPWMVIACIHSLEASLSFNGHLHNGDSLQRAHPPRPARPPLSRHPPVHMGGFRHRRPGNETHQRDLRLEHPRVPLLLRALQRLGLPDRRGPQDHPAPPLTLPLVLHHPLPEREIHRGQSFRQQRRLAPGGSRRHPEISHRGHGHRAGRF